MADKFVDFSASNDGDGTAFGQAGSPGGAGAFNTLIAKTFTTGDKVWIRRKTLSSIATTITAGVDSVTYIGWPISGDVFFSTRPSAAQSAWDGDAAQFFVLQFTTATLTICLTSSGNNCAFHRITLQRDHTVPGRLLVNSGSGNAFYTPQFINNTTPTSATSAQNYITSAGDGCVMRSPYFKIGCISSLGAVVFSGNFLTMDAAVYDATRCDTGPLISHTGSKHYVNGLTVHLTANSSLYGDTVLSLASTNSNFYNVQMDVTGTTMQAPIISFNAANGSYLEINKYQDVNGVGQGLALTCSTGTTDRPFTAVFNNLAYSSTTYAIASSGSGACVNGRLLFRGCTSANTSGYYNSGTAATNTAFIFSSCTKGGADWITTAKLSTNSWVRSLDASNNFEVTFSGSGKLISSNTYRTGGETYSYKVNSTGAPTNPFRGLFPLSDFDVESQWVSLLSGSNTLTIYGAYKNYTGNPIDGSYFWAEVDYIDGSGKPQTARTPITLVTDSSTWNNDTGLTVFKTTVTFTTNGTQVSPVRLYIGAPQDGTGYYYIDPKIVMS